MPVSASIIGLHASPKRIWPIQHKTLWTLTFKLRSTSSANLSHTRTLKIEPTACFDDVAFHRGQLKLRIQERRPPL
jgi:hypothetical protein